ncbi:MAG: hypothetical protein LBV61_05840 [Burkholderiaceae bacterium]|nr:hypothetical protein [Burkholderiaceae bacterium]
MNDSATLVHCAHTHPLVAAHARHSPSHDGALCLDWARLCGLFGSAGLIHSF